MRTRAAFLFAFLLAAPGIPGAAAALPLFMGSALAGPAVAASKVRKLINRLGASSGTEQLRVIAVLGGLDDDQEEAAAALLTFFDIRKASPRQSSAVVAALGRLGDKRAARPLSDAWDYLNTLRLRMELPAHLQILRAGIIESLGRIGAPGTLQVLLSAAEDPDPLVVQRAAEALGRLKEKKAVPYLMELLARGGDMGQSAYEALGEIGDTRALAVLERGLGAEDAFIKAQAGYALMRMGEDAGGKALGKLIAGDPRGSKPGILAAYYLARLDEERGLDYLVRIVERRDAPLRALAAEALGKSGNKKAVLPLTEALASGDRDLRLMIVRALGRLGGKRAVYQLYKAVDDADSAVADAARLALADLGEWVD